jgi:hypothetical protein
MAHCGYEPTAVLASTSSVKESMRSLVSSSPLASPARRHRKRSRRRETVGV